MLAVVKKPRTNKVLFEIKGNIPKKLLEYLHSEFGQNLELFEKDDEDFVHIFETNWYQKIVTATMPGDMLRIYRENAGLTQTELGEKLGHVTEKEIAEIERHKHPLTEDMAKQLAHMFDAPVERFLQ